MTFARSARLAMALAYVFALPIVMDACGGSAEIQHKPDSQDDIATAVERAAKANSLYSFRYYYGRRTLYVHLPAYDPGVTCASFAASNGRYTDVWYLDLYIDWANPLAEATIGTFFPPNPADGSAAYVDIVHDNGRKWTVSASGGKVTLIAAPRGEDDQLSGVRVRARLDFSFPIGPRALTSCQGGAFLSDGGTVGNQQSCTCTDLAGNASTCVKTTEDNCCAPSGSGVESFSLDVVADACGLFCGATAGDPSQCQELSGT